MGSTADFANNIHLAAEGKNEEAEKEAEVMKAAHHAMNLVVAKGTVQQQA